MHKCKLSGKKNDNCEYYCASSYRFQSIFLELPMPILVICCGCCIIIRNRLLLSVSPALQITIHKSDVRVCDDGDADDNDGWSVIGPKSAVCE